MLSLCPVMPAIALPACSALAGTGRKCCSRSVGAHIRHCAITMWLDMGPLAVTSHPSIGNDPEMPLCADSCLQRLSRPALPVLSRVTARAARLPRRMRRRIALQHEHGQRMLSSRPAAPRRRSRCRSCRLCVQPLGAQLRLCLHARVCRGIQRVGPLGLGRLREPRRR